MSAPLVDPKEMRHLKNNIRWHLNREKTRLDTVFKGMNVANRPSSPEGKLRKSKHGSEEKKPRKLQASPYKYEPYQLNALETNNLFATPVPETTSKRSGEEFRSTMHKSPLAFSPFPDNGTFHKINLDVELEFSHDQVRRTEAELLSSLTTVKDKQPDSEDPSLKVPPILAQYATCTPGPIYVYDAHLGKVNVGKSPAALINQHEPRFRQRPSATPGPIYLPQIRPNTRGATIGVPTSTPPPVGSLDAHRTDSPGPMYQIRPAEADAEARAPKFTKASRVRDFETCSPGPITAAVPAPDKVLGGVMMPRYPAFAHYFEACKVASETPGPYMGVETFESMKETVIIGKDDRLKYLGMVKRDPGA
jgi:hypothetical protein